MSDILKNKDITINHIRNLKKQGAKLTESISSIGEDVPPTAGIFAESWKEWTADGKTAKKGSLWLYKGVGYQARTDIQKIENYSPDKATNNYAARPIPNAEGIYPYTYNMDSKIGMLIEENGVIYECYASPVTAMIWGPSQIPASFRVYEG